MFESPVVPVATPQRVIREALDVYDPAATSNETSVEQGAQDAEHFRRITADGPVISFVNAMLAGAVETGASDIHFESTGDGLNVRYRVQGKLVPQVMDRSLNRSAIFARLKVLAGMNVTEKRLPQDGRIALTFSGRPIDFRASELLPISWTVSGVN